MIKMYISKALLTIFLITIVIYAKAQKDTSTNHPDKVTIFDNTPGSNNNTYDRQKKVTQQKTIIKINPLLFFDGDIPVYVERVISPGLTVEVAPGLTYDNFMSDLFALDNLTSLQYVDGMQAQIGYSFEAALKYFPGINNTIDGIYLSPDISYRHYSVAYPATPSSGGSMVTTYVNGHTNNVDFKLLLGHENESNWIENFFFDWYIGLGLRTTSALQYVTATDASGTNYIAPNSVSYVKPAFYAGFKLGIGF
jgi:hypothetical protein